jgi:outer membrane lipoprotein-sorting protein
VVDDYIHTIEGEENIDGRMCFRIKLLAKEDAGVLWSHQLWWVDKKEFIVLKAELFDEDGLLVRTEYGKEIKILDGRLLPTLLELIPAENPENKTVLKIIEMKFNVKMEESFFSQQNMKTIR